MAMSSRTEISERRACRLVGLSRTVLHYEPKMNEPNLQLGERIGELAAVRRRFGYRRIHALLRREGSRANHKRVYRLYRLAGLAVGELLAFVINKYSPLPAYVPIWAIAVGVGISAAVGIVFGLWPAWKAARLDPIEALRWE